MAASPALAEQWAPIGDTEYQVSTLGRVKGFRGRLLRPKDNGKGYKNVCLCIEGKHEYRYVHRLVCEAFIGPSPHGDWHADHINGDRGDNRALNLRWLSPQDNRKLRNIRCGDTHPYAKLDAVRVRAIRASGKSSANDAVFARMYGVSRSTIASARLGQTWRHVNAR
ncbi:NUMOD4 motif-containing HNH endonuclease [Methylorubrum extorquens]|uniref:NUMOD4 motif-containing HNH endonuclease n=1 Tax=Methylorubrum extorquens TaxID=408 RepID=UPI0005C21D21|nr:NUMOD4 motif-containing HNH endonuclease [Methylorubrum extorquens]MCP1545352.1 hypothetical protein [Methylorubrum extorquens]MCP1587301.1 hypothetical protein [Methylorubrum extorquens]